MTNFPAIPTRKPTLAILSAAVLLAAASPALAGQRVIVEKNHVMRVTLSAPAGSVIVGNPDIADVNVVDSRTVYIMGKGFGNSAVTITGRDGKPLFDGEVVVSGVQQGAITVYKGLKPSLMVCSNICVSQDVGDSNTAQASSPLAVAPAAPASQ
ncbi:MAG: pilus assembly protein N-terminal domain-containing protein [Asticcacaulis sp.]|nr:pilus assembly protein N-terminal domain-containing protein [Asticcacaulis sp.]